MNTNLNPRFFVVIHTVAKHCSGLEHVIEQAQIAELCGADGVFLIPDYAKGQGIKASTEEQLLYAKELLRQGPPKLKVGVNFFMKNMAGIAPQLYELQPDFIQTDEKSLIGVDRTQLPTTEFFCGVAFKYSLYENLTGESLRTHVKEVARMCDVPTTSGVGTGCPAPISKIHEVRSYLPEGKRFAVASGVDSSNVEAYLRQGVTDFLVATSLRHHIDDEHRDILNERAICVLAEKIHSYQLV